MEWVVGVLGRWGVFGLVEGRLGVKSSGVVGEIRTGSLVDSACRRDGDLKMVVAVVDSAVVVDTDIRLALAEEVDGKTATWAAKQSPVEGGRPVAPSWEVEDRNDHL